jgi:signal transduction histidine kinase
MAAAMESTPLTDEQRGMLSVINESGHILMTLLSDILDLSKIEAGRMVFEAAVFDVAASAQAVARLYSEMGVPCLPIALNSGLFWPRRSMRRYPGTIVVEVLDPIPPGFGQEAFFQRLQREVEDATARLVTEGKRERTHNRTRDASLASSP